MNLLPWATAHLSCRTLLFHTADGVAFANIPINGHRETWAIRSKSFRRWLMRAFFEKTGKAPGSGALQSALNLIEAKALFDGPERAVYVRTGALGGKLYLDLCDNTWRAVEIDATGWRIIDDPAVRFRRASGMKPLPAPVKGGSIETLRSFLNVRSDADFVLGVSWALAALRNRGPYPLLVLGGEQGSAKSTFSSILRALLDPNTAPLRAMPREDRDLFIAASNGHLLAFDNVSGLPPWLSDTLCRLATGGGFAVRQLLTDQDEVLFDAARPIILNGIESIVTRPDLADRALFLELEPIPEERRRPEAELWAAFEAERPRILGTLLDAVAKGLAMLPQTRSKSIRAWPTSRYGRRPAKRRFGRLALSWRPIAAIATKRLETVIDTDPVAGAVLAVMATRTEWMGTATDLLDELGEAAGARIAKSKDWPQSPRALSGRLRRAATFLRKIGIEISFDREGRARTRMIRIGKGTPLAPETEGTPASTSSAPSAHSQKAKDANGSARRESRTVAVDVDGLAGASMHRPSAKTH